MSEVATGQRPRMIDASTPNGSALLLAYELHAQKRISRVELRAFEQVLSDPADFEAAQVTKSRFSPDGESV